MIRRRKQKASEEKLAGQSSRNPAEPMGRRLYQTFICVMMSTMMGIPAYASGGTNMWTKAQEIMKDVYDQIVTISTIAAVVTICIALLMMNFSKNGKTVDESRAWVKRIAISWAIINGLGFIMAYVTPFFNGGKWAA